MKIKRGWIKQYRRDIDDLADLTDQEYRYYKTSCMLAVWDRRNKRFGMFDARTKTIKAEAFPSWSVGKINMVKNSLLKKGFYKSAPDRYLEIANAKYVFGKTKEIESLIHGSERNFHLHENDIQDTESKISGIKNDMQKLANDKRMPWHKDSMG